MSISEKLYTLGELMAENLNIQGVEASANEGLTSLANKILEIQTFFSSQTIMINWNDDDNAASLRPSSIVCHLYANDGEIRTFSLSDANNWTAMATGVPQYYNDEQITYTWGIQEVLGYITSKKINDNLTIITLTRSKPQAPSIA